MKEIRILMLLYGLYLWRLNSKMILLIIVFEKNLIKFSKKKILIKRNASIIFEVKKYLFYKIILKNNNV